MLQVGEVQSTLIIFEFLENGGEQASAQAQRQVTRTRNVSELATKNSPKGRGKDPYQKVLHVAHFLVDVVENLSTAVCCLLHFLTLLRLLCNTDHERQTGLSKASVSIQPR